MSRATESPADQRPGGVPALHWWTPLPPTPSGIADHNVVFVPAVASRTELVVVAPGNTTAVLPASVRVVAPNSLAAPRGGLPVYHLGNHEAFHGWILDAALARPGLLVLHDLSLLDLYLTRFAGEPGALAAELAYNYGSAVNDWLPEAPTPAWVRLHRLEVGLLRRVVEASLGVVVHSAWARGELERRFPATPIFDVPPATAPRTLVDTASARRALGLSPDATTVGVLGAIADHKQPELAIEAFLAVHREAPNTNLVVAGRVADEATVARVLGMVRRSGLEPEHVAIRLDDDLAAFTTCLAACDALVDPRDQAAGAVPGTVMAALGAGKVVITRDLPALRGLDDRWRRTVPLSAPDLVERFADQVLDIVRDPTIARVTGAEARAWIARNAAPDVVAARFVEIIHALPEAPADPGDRPAGTPPELPRVNAWGDFDATTGLMEAGRAALLALELVADLTLVPVRTTATRSSTRRVVPAAALTSSRATRAVDLLLVNCSELLVVSDAELDNCDHIIGWWYWEMPTLSRGLALQAERVDEIWAPSTFTRDAFMCAVPRPVHVVPPVVDVPLPVGGGRSRFGLPEEPTLVFFNFDTLSTDARKNPWAVIQAFGAAFDESERQGAVRLVLKVQNLHRTETKALVAPLREAVRSVDGILLDDDLTRGEMNTLLGCIDIYVSLHRSEGFGLGLAEAMFLGKPTIGTAYSGNMDFMNPANSCLVGYRLRRVRTDDHRYFPDVARVYEPGMVWAEPDVEQAARWLRFLVDHPEARERYGRRGAVDIRRTNSRAAVARVLRERLAAASVPTSLRRGRTEHAS